MRAVFALAWLAFLSLAFPAPAMADKPNVILIFVDDLGQGDLGSFGSEVNLTPNIDALAERGVRMTTHYVTNPPCSPSRSALITGMYAQRFGKFGMARGLALPDDHPTLAQFMRDAGYVTGQIGKWDLGSEEQGPHKIGFTQVAKWPPSERNIYQCVKPDGTALYRTEQDGNYLVEFIDRNEDKPFFLYYSPFAIHSPATAPDQAVNDSKDKQAIYAGMLGSLDDQVGRLVKSLEQHELSENTLIILSGDNGAHPNGSSAPYRGGKMGGTQFEGWVRTPAIAVWPGVIAEGKVFDGMACTLDYYATAAAIAGKKLPDRCDGKNLLPYLTGEKKGDVHEYLYWYNADPKDAPRRHLSAVRYKDWRLVWLKKEKRWGLFDLVKDPEERVDLAEREPEMLEALKNKHAAFVKELPSLDDIPPYSRGWMKPPEGWGWVFTDP